MGRSWHLGTILGIRLYLHWSFLLLPLWVVLVSWGSAPETQLFYLAVMTAVFACVLLHELGHALTALCFDIRTRDITLYPFGGVARLERLSDRPWEEFCIALGGPAVNVVIAALLVGVLGILIALDPELAFQTAFGAFVLHLMIGNIALVVFNLLPAFPMDGGRVLRALLSLKFGQLRATRVAAAIGIPMAILIGVGGAFWLHSPWLPAVALFVWLAGQQELYVLEMKHQQEQRRRETVFPQSLIFESSLEPELVYRPRITVYVWDERTGTWIPQGPKPAPFTWL